MESTPPHCQTTAASTPSRPPSGPAAASMRRGWTGSSPRSPAPRCSGSPSAGSTPSVHPHPLQHPSCAALAPQQPATAPWQPMPGHAPPAPHTHRPHHCPCRQHPHRQQHTTQPTMPRPSPTAITPTAITTPSNTQSLSYTAICTRFRSTTNRPSEARHASFAALSPSQCAPAVVA